MTILLQLQIGLPLHLRSLKFYNNVFLSNHEKINALLYWLFIKNINAQNSDTLIYADEKHFKNIQQLTFNGDNAEAYWSYDDKQIIFQRKNEKENIMCDRMFIGNIPQNGEAFHFKQLSNGKGRTTCGYFLPDGKHVIYASTYLGGDSCPPVPDRSKYGNRYLWPMYDTYDIFFADTSGKIIKQLTKTKGYDAEGTLSPDGKKMIFTSIRNGDLDLYIMDLKTEKVTQITNELGYDGGAWFSPDGNKIVGVQAGRKQRKKLQIIKIFYRKVWLRQHKWKCLLPMLMAAIKNKLQILDRRTGHLILRLMESILFFAAIMNMHMAFHSICI